MRIDRAIAHQIKEDCSLIPLESDSIALVPESSISSVQVESTLSLLSRLKKWFVAAVETVGLFFGRWIRWCISFISNPSILQLDASFLLEFDRRKGGERGLFQSWWEEKFRQFHPDIQRRILQQNLEERKGDPWTDPSGSTIQLGDQFAFAYVVKLAPEMKNGAIMIDPIDDVRRYVEIEIGRGR